MDRYVTRSRIGAVPATPAAGGEHKLPVVLVSHAWTGCREQSTLLCEELASHGFVVLGCDHVGDCPWSEFGEDLDGEAAAQPSREAVGLLVYQGHPSFRAWASAVESGDPSASDDGPSARLMPLVRSMIGTLMTATLEGFDAMMDRHGASAVGAAFLQLQAFRRFQLRLRAADLSFLLDCLTSLHDEGTMPVGHAPSAGERIPPRVGALRQLGPHLDLGRVYAAGQSFGGGTASFACTVDPRFHGLFGLDPWMWTLPAAGPSLHTLVGSEAVARELTRQAQAAQPPLFIEAAPRSRRKPAADADDGVVRSIDDGEGIEPGSLRCPALFICASESWVAERCTRDAYGIDQRNQLADLCVRGGAVATTAWLEQGRHFDLTDIPSWAPRFGALISLVSPVHTSAGFYALQLAMLDAFLALHASAPEAASAMASKRAGQLRAARASQLAAAQDALRLSAPKLLFGFGPRRPEVAPSFSMGSGGGQQAMAGGTKPELQDGEGARMQAGGGAARSAVRSARSPNRRGVSKTS